jgi:CubicO group peptidase (beta-lactamase class C family)
MSKADRVQLGIDWAGVVVERATGLKLNDYLQEKLLKPIGITEMSMFPSHAMQAKLAYMHQRGADGTLRPCNHPMRASLVVDQNDKARMEKMFNSGGGGMFANARDYCSEFPGIYLCRPRNANTFLKKFLLSC